MKLTTTLLCMASLVALFLFGQESSQSTLPKELRVPADQKLVFQAHGTGDQVYACKAVDNQYHWTLKAPDAQLIDTKRRVVGHHFAGPTWEAEDGSRVIGKQSANVASPDPNAIPWLRLEATAHEKDGELSRVVSIQRLNTKGGKAPADGCANSNAGAEVRIPYEADYYFYANFK